MTPWGRIMNSYKDIITVEPGKRGGKPCIRGMRITVYDVLEYLASGMTNEDILGDFPYLTEEDIRACLQYAADREHQQMVVHACHWRTKVSYNSPPAEMRRLGCFRE